MPLTQEKLGLFWKLFVSSYRESSHEESKICAFPIIYALVTLITSKLKIHQANPANLDILKFIALSFYIKGL